MKLGEIVVLPSKIKPTIHFGRITGEYEFIPENANPYYHARKIDWFAQDVSRSAFDQSILYSLGAFMTICRIKQETEIMAIITAYGNHTQAHPSQERRYAGLPEQEDRDIEEDALQEIADIILRKTKGHKLSTLVEAILRAKGFTTFVSPPGPDNGVDILASYGELGFGSPKICVQVKSSDLPVERAVLDQLGGVMNTHQAEYGLLVSWSGFRASVERERAKQFFEIRLWTHKEILSEFLRYYEKMDEEIREWIPLKRIWVPDATDA